MAGAPPRRPTILVLGGGAGTATVARGLADAGADVVAAVGTADDGGSSGELRDRLGVLPPGDLRRALTALPGRSLEAKALLEFRFPSGSPFAGHPVGNLLLAAAELQTGDRGAAVPLVSQFLAARGLVLPATREDVELVLSVPGQPDQRGESHIASRPLPGPRPHLRLDPPAAADSRVLEAVRRADATVIAPGSLYTSVLPALLPAGLVQALTHAPGPVVVLTNLFTEPGHTDGFTARDHAEEVARHLRTARISTAVYNRPPRTDTPGTATWMPPPPPDAGTGIRWLGRHLSEAVPHPAGTVRADRTHRHHSNRTARALLRAIAGA